MMCLLVVATTMPTASLKKGHRYTSLDSILIEIDASFTYYAKRGRSKYQQAGHVESATRTAITFAGPEGTG